jgi:hypothetical protein
MAMASGRQLISPTTGVQSVLAKTLASGLAKYFTHFVRRKQASSTTTVLMETSVED